MNEDEFDPDAYEAQYSPEALAESERDWQAQVEWFGMAEQAAVEELMTENQIIAQWENYHE